MMKDPHQLFVLWGHVINSKQSGRASHKHSKPSRKVQYTALKSHKPKSKFCLLNSGAACFKLFTYCAFGLARAFSRLGPPVQRQQHKFGSRRAVVEGCVGGLGHVGCNNVCVRDVEVRGVGASVCVCVSMLGHAESRT